MAVGSDFLIDDQTTEIAPQHLSRSSSPVCFCISEFTCAVAQAPEYKISLGCLVGPLLPDFLFLL